MQSFCAVQADLMVQVLDQVLVAVAAEVLVSLVYLAHLAGLVLQAYLVRLVYLEHLADPVGLVLRQKL